MQLSPLNFTLRRSSRAVSTVSLEASNVLSTPPRALEKTYQLEPTPGKEFIVAEARDIVKRILVEQLGPSLRRAPTISRSSNTFILSFSRDTPIVCWLANFVRQRLVREISATDVRQGGRHKIVVHVLHVDELPEVPPAELLVSSCGLWNSDTDRWFSVQHQTEMGTIVVTVFACYHE
ncbi:hypothetical protein D915_000716 [Fasciola hepatica]|uniref:Uncharacterized protein n=1 Tax=Fasciola hepatica TaxID=6192 RepID=A0A4E0RR68_FASHE|nr:hypothetical protein D915_000716 [Fasciola hepatica]